MLSTGSLASAPPAPRVSTSQAHPPRARARRRCASSCAARAMQRVRPSRTGAPRAGRAARASGRRTRGSCSAGPPDGACPRRRRLPPRPPPACRSRGCGSGTASAATASRARGRRGRPGTCGTDHGAPRCRRRCVRSSRQGHTVSRPRRGSLAPAASRPSRCARPASCRVSRAPRGRPPCFVRSTGNGCRSAPRPTPPSRTRDPPARRPGTACVPPNTRSCATRRGRAGTGPAPMACRNSRSERRRRRR